MVANKLNKPQKIKTKIRNVISFASIMGPENNQLELVESVGEDQVDRHSHHNSNIVNDERRDDSCPVLSYHLNDSTASYYQEIGEFLLNGTSESSTTEIASSVSHRDYTENGCHSTTMTLPTTAQTMKQNGHLSNGWSDQHDGTLLVSSTVDSSVDYNEMSIRHRLFQSHNHQQSNGTAKPPTVNSNVKVILDHNKNHQCELPLSSSEIASAQTSGSLHSTMTPYAKTANSHTVHSDDNFSRIPTAINPSHPKNPPPSKQSIKGLHELYEEPPVHIAIMCYLSYVVLTVFGYLRDFMRKTGLEKNLAAVERNREGYPSLYKNFESFYTRNIYRRIRDCWNRPIASVPGAYIDVIDRFSTDYNWTFEHPGTTHKEINMGSYNYLGFAENQGSIHEQVLDTLQQTRVGVCSVRSELGTSKTVQELERLMAQFLGAEACIVFGMGFATNSTNIATLVNKGCLILSDALNHASLILGCRLSGATIKTFKHNDMIDLERKVRKFIIEGQPKSHRPWKKIIIFVEGIYSMEGTIINLPELIRIKKHYKCNIYLDEAHSIGALGPNGRGVVDYYNCDPRDIDVLMGTFTKSFGAAGGYIAGSQALVDHVRASSFSSIYAVAMSPVIAKQILGVVQVLMGLDGTDEGAKRIAQLARNTRYFRQRLAQMGFIVYGNDDSPVVPLLLCFCPKIAAVIRLAQNKGLGFIGAGFPATSLTTGRVRFCISAAHTKPILDRSLEVMSEIGDQIGVKYSRLQKNMRPIAYEEV